MQIRTIKKEDCIEIFNWRNNKISRIMSFNNQIISFSDHEKWFKENINNPLIVFFIGENENGKLGIVRFELDLKKNFSEVSINMNPEMRGKGFGRELLKKSIEAYLKNRKCVLKAKIKIENEISMKLFLSMGFSISEKKKEFFYLEYGINISFKSVDDSCSEILYLLLKERNHFISHIKMPSYEEHLNFIKSKPYLFWYIISINEKAIGAFYIKKDNSIGINIKNPSISIVSKIIEFIKINFKPQKAITSQIPNYFYFNIADSNDKMKTIFNNLGLIPIQVSYKLN